LVYNALYITYYIIIYIYIVYTYHVYHPKNHPFYQLTSQAQVFTAMAALPTLIASVAGLGPLDPATSHGFIIENPIGDQNGVNPPVYEGL
jgi:hypothetical protein